MRHLSFLRSHAVSGALASVAALLVFAGCVKECTRPECKGPQIPDYRPLTTYAAPLYNLVLTYENHNAEAVDQYKTLIASNYQFRYYDPQSSTPSTPQFWGYSEEIATAQGLLTDATVTTLALVFPLADTANIEPSSFVGDPVGTMKITINGIDLQVQRGDILYQTHGSADFYVAPIAGVYQIVRWEDNTAPPAAAPRPASKGAGDGPLASLTSARFPHPGDALREAARLAAQQGS